MSVDPRNGRSPPRRYPQGIDVEPEQFVSEPIVPDRGSFSPELMATGLASLPGGFTWRGRHFDIVECLDHHKQSSAEGGHAGGQVYLRRQVFRVRLDDGSIASLYVLRDSRAGKRRWFMYSRASSDGGPAATA
ncbi:MAG: DUF6504 family protein [Planctomycetota bacterium]|jgi:hypothetical protein